MDVGCNWHGFKICFFPKCVVVIGFSMIQWIPWLILMPLINLMDPCSFYEFNCLLNQL